ncbi:TPA: hypothetical protein ACS8CD_001812 [Providencia alcalifaciens]
MALTNLRKNRIVFMGFLIGVLILFTLLVLGSPLPLARIGKHADMNSNIELLLTLLMLEAMVMFFLLVKKRRINQLLFFLLFPYVISIITWVATNYLANPDLYNNLPTLTGSIGVIFVTQYIIYGVWVVPLVSFMLVSLLLRLK